MFPSTILVFDQRIARLHSVDAIMNCRVNPSQLCNCLLLAQNINGRIPAVYRASPVTIGIASGMQLVMETPCATAETAFAALFTRGVDEECKALWVRC